MKLKLKTETGDLKGLKLVETSVTLASDNVALLGTIVVSSGKGGL